NRRNALLKRSGKQYKISVKQRLPDGGSLLIDLNFAQQAVQFAQLRGPIARKFHAIPMSRPRAIRPPISGAASQATTVVRASKTKTPFCPLNPVNTSHRVLLNALLPIEPSQNVA